MMTYIVVQQNVSMARVVEVIGVHAFLDFAKQRVEHIIGRDIVWSNAMGGLLYCYDSVHENQYLIFEKELQA